ncbi:MAG: response regulator, partial [Gammaproteobacteria bacterium]
EAESGLDSWRKAPRDHGVVALLQRGLHTLKGGARMAGITPVGRLSHKLEDVFTRVAEDTMAPTPGLMDVVQLSFDRLVELLQAVGDGGTLADVTEYEHDLDVFLNPDAATASKAKTVSDPSTPAEGAIASSDSIGGTPQNEPSSQEDAPREPVDSEPEEPAPGAGGQRQDVLRVEAGLLGHMVNLSGEVSIYRSRLEQQLGAFHFNLRELDGTVSRLKEQLRILDIETEAQMLARYDREPAEAPEGEDFDPLELDRFSQMQELSRSLVESVNDVLSLKGILESNTRESETLLAQQARVNTDLQEALMRTRMVPFSNYVPRLRRLTRQTARSLGKQVELEVSGGEGEIDRNVLERINAPLEHLIRNAIAHGIESAEERQAAGKPELGRLTIHFARRGPEVRIGISDDGRGIDVDAIRRKAIERKLLPENSDLTDRDLQQFILVSGFSTAKKVSQISGRGVGLDVVHSEVKQLGGSLEMDSTRGQGTSFSMNLPFTVAVNRALLVGVTDEAYAVPLVNLDGVVRMGRAELEQVYAAESPLYKYGGETYHVQYLGALVGSGLPDLPESDDTLPVVLVRAGDKRIGLQVDSLQGTREIVVKSLGPQLSTVTGIAGATILGDGNVVLILEVAALTRMGTSLQQQLEMAEAKEAEERPIKVMVVDDSITMRKVASRVLERHHMEVITAKDGVEALTLLHEQTPDVMLLDIEMPRMDGYELATHMRRDARWQQVPIIMITSRTGAKHKERAMDIGVDRYLGKPYQENELLLNIRELAESGREVEAS